MPWCGVSCCASWVFAWLFFFHPPFIQLYSQVLFLYVTYITHIHGFMTTEFRSHSLDISLTWLCCCCCCCYESNSARSTDWLTIGWIVSVLDTCTCICVRRCIYASVWMEFHMMTKKSIFFQPFTSFFLLQMRIRMPSSLLRFFLSVFTFASLSCVQSDKWFSRYIF